MKLLFLAIVVINAVLYAAVQGWLGHDVERLVTPAQREPERLLLQVAPERLEVLKADERGSTVVAVQGGAQVVPDRLVIACLRLPASTMEAAQQLADKLAHVLPPETHYVQVRSQAASPMVRVVHVGPNTEAEAQRKVRELTAAGMTDLSVVMDDPGMRFAIHLGDFATEDQARIRQASALAHGLKTQLVQRPQPAQGVVEVRDLPGDLRPLVDTAAAESSLSLWSDCAVRPGAASRTVEGQAANAK